SALVGFVALGWVALAQPANDDFSNAQAVPSIPFTHGIGTSGATVEPGEPAPSCAPAGASVWYKYVTPPQPPQAALVADTLGSDFDTVLAVYTGTALANLTEVPFACNDDSAGGRQSSVGFTASAGMTY